MNSYITYHCRVIFATLETRKEKYTNKVRKSPKVAFRSTKEERKIPEGQSTKEGSIPNEYPQI